MNKGRKLLDYVQMLDSSLYVGGFRHSSGFEAEISKGNIHNRDELDSFLRCQLVNVLLQTEIKALKEVYNATESNDLRRIAMIDKSVQDRNHNPIDKRTAQKNGKRLLKLARALYPWMDFDELEETLEEHEAVGCLITVHAWINQKLGTDCDQAIQGYIFSAVSSCIHSASVVMNISSEDEKRWIQTSLDLLAPEWHSVTMHSKDVHEFSSTA